MLHCSMYYYCCHVALPMTVSQCTVAVVAAVVVAAAWVWYGMEIENVKLCVDWLTGQRGLAAWDCDWGMIFGGASCACLTRWHTRLQKQSLMKIFSFRYGSRAKKQASWNLSDSSPDSYDCRAWTNILWTIHSILFLNAVVYDWGTKLTTYILRLNINWVI